MLPAQGHIARRETSCTHFVLKGTLDQRNAMKLKQKGQFRGKKAALTSHPGGASRRHVRALSPMDAAVIWLIMSLPEAGKPI